MSSDSSLRKAVGTAIAGPSPPGRTWYMSAPSDTLPEPLPYVVYTLDSYGNSDPITERLDLNVDVYGFLGSATAGPDAVDTIVSGIHAALQAVAVPSVGGAITGFYRTRRQPLPTDDARVTRVRLSYGATYAPQDVANTLDSSNPS